MGLKTYRSIYGTFSTISMASIIYGYFKYPKGIIIIDMYIKILRFFIIIKNLIGDLVIKSKIGGPRRFAGFVL